MIKYLTLGMLFLSSTSFSAPLHYSCDNPPYHDRNDCERDSQIILNMGSCEMLSNSCEIDRKTNQWKCIAVTKNCAPSDLTKLNTAQECPAKMQGAGLNASARFQHISFHKNPKLKGFVRLCVDPNMPNTVNGPTVHSDANPSAPAAK